MEEEKKVICPDFENCKSDIDFINAYLKVATKKQLKAIHIDIERIFLYGR